MTGSHSTPADRVTVTKSFVPNSETTPSTASTPANGLPAASASFFDRKLTVPGSVVSSWNFNAFGFGLAFVRGVAVAEVQEATWANARTVFALDARS